MFGDPSQKNHMSSDAGCLLLFTKPARPGRVKTRLIGRLSAEQAAELHGAFLDDALGRLRQGAFERRIAWALDDEDSIPEVDGWVGVRQAGVDLGARLHAALAAAARTHAFVAAIGSDHPELDVATVEEAFDRLRRGDDAVIGPAADGGYYLIALRREAVHADLFSDIAWSTDQVYEATRARARNRGLTVGTLRLGHDVDDAAGLERLAGRLEAGTVAAACPRTRALLVRWRLVSEGGA